VRFADPIDRVVGHVVTRGEMTAEERSGAYLTQADMHKIRSDAKFVTRYYAAREAGTIRQIDRAYASIMEMSLSFESDRQYEEYLRRDTLEEAGGFHEWCRKKISSRGLERYTSLKHRRERTEFASEARKAVLRLATNPSVPREDVALFYYEYARSATLLARLMGEADRVAALEAARKMKSLPKKDGRNKSRKTTPVEETTEEAKEEKTPVQEPQQQQQQGEMTSVQEEEGQAEEEEEANNPIQDGLRQLEKQLSSKSFDRRALLLSARDQSSSARLLCSELGKKLTGSNRRLV
jgi:hypothetical protein